MFNDFLGDITIDGVELKMTCVACPEQYDAYIGDQQVGYLRLRHGDFRVDFPDCGHKTILFRRVRGDGCFEEDEREQHLTDAVKAIKLALQGVDFCQCCVRPHDE